MPIYMDRHDVSETVTAENVAQLHQADLKVQDTFNCKGLTYWFDGKRKTAFCLIEAPDRDSISRMHEYAHGEVPNRIIEVDDSVVESFLGRIADPENSQNTGLNIINDPAFRTIMVARIKRSSLKHVTPEQIHSVIENYNKSIVTALNKFKGSIVKQKRDYFLSSFDSVTNAVLCAQEIQAALWTPAHNGDDPGIKLKIGLSAGSPVTEKEGLFEDTIKKAERLCEVVKGQIVVSSEVKELYESEISNISIDTKYITALNSNDETFISLLMDYTEREWTNATLNVNDFSRCLGYSKAQLYRKMTSITGMSPNSFIKEYRLDKALKLLSRRVESISQIAFETGFNSASYFSRCFQETFGILPSYYIKSFCH
ncbi:MAG TPA: nickel-binding protein [Cyclobacteriaceae bacterium]